MQEMVWRWKKREAGQMFLVDSGLRPSALVPMALPRIRTAHPIAQKLWHTANFAKRLEFRL